jgi:hypothetical protein
MVTRAVRSVAIAPLLVVDEADCTAAAATVVSRGRQWVGREMSFLFLLRAFGQGESRTNDKE